jgi:hypothetical protein
MEFLEEVARRKANKGSVSSIYDKLYDVTVLKTSKGTQTVVHNVYKNEDGKP